MLPHACQVKSVAPWCESHAAKLLHVISWPEKEALLQPLVPLRADLGRGWRRSSTRMLQAQQGVASSVSLLCPL